MRREKYKNIENIEDLLPHMKDYGVILSENRADVVFEPGKECEIKAHLWYNFEKDILPNIDTSYLFEKLAIKDGKRALKIIEDWNELYPDYYPKSSFERIIKIDDLKFGILPSDHTHGRIVMGSQVLRYPNQIEIHCGRGYPWIRLWTLAKPMKQPLMGAFQLTEDQALEFIEQW